MEEDISPTGHTDFEGILILACQIELRKSNSIPKTSLILNNYRHHTPWIFASVHFFLHCLPFGFSLTYRGMLQKWNDPYLRSKFLKYFAKHPATYSFSLNTTKHVPKLTCNNCDTSQCYNDNIVCFGSFHFLSVWKSKSKTCK